MKLPPVLDDLLSHKSLEGMVETIGRFFTSLFTFFVVVTLLIGGMAGFVAWFFFRDVVSAEPRLSPVLLSLYTMGATCVLADAAIISFSMVTKSWPAPAETLGSASRTEHPIRGWRLLLGLSLILLPLGLVPTLASVSSLIRETPALAADPTADHIVMVPILGLVTTVSVMVGSAGLAILLFVKSRVFANEFIAFVLAQLGLVLGHFALLELMQSLAHASPGPVRLIQEFQSVFGAAAENHAWLFGAYAIWVPVLILTYRATRD